MEGISYQMVRLVSLLLSSPSLPLLHHHNHIHDHHDHHNNTQHNTNTTQQHTTLGDRHRERGEREKETQPFSSSLHHLPGADMCIATPSGFLLTLRFSGLVHHVSGPDKTKKNTLCIYIFMYVYVFVHMYLFAKHLFSYFEKNMLS